MTSNFNLPSFTVSEVKHIFGFLKPVSFYAHLLLIYFAHISFRYTFMKGFIG